MARYIDADKLEKDLPQSVPKHNVIINGNEYPVFLVDHILHKIRNYPTADVVEVVRCKDCEFRGTDDCPNSYYSEYEGAYVDSMNDDDFCSYGERRKENAEIH